jgi:hypothetical protein
VSDDNVLLSKAEFVDLMQQFDQISRKNKRLTEICVERRKRINKLEGEIGKLRAKLKER